MTTTTDTRPTCGEIIETRPRAYGYGGRGRREYHRCGRTARFARDYPQVKHLGPDYYCGTHAKKYPNTRELPAAR